MRGAWLATGAVASILVALEAGALAPASAQRTSDVLQLLLAAAAAAACLAAAPRALGVGRAFFTALALGCLSWAGGQAFWVMRAAPFSPGATLAEADILFTASTALFLVGFVMRPDRARARSLPVAIDVAVLAVALLYLFAELALVHLLAGDLAAYEDWSLYLFDFRGLAVLPTLLWALRDSAPPWRGLYARLAPAFVLLQVGGLVTNQSFRAGVALPYHPGLYDLPWTLPFLWIAALVSAFKPEPGSVRVAAASPADGWSRARRATVVAFVAVLLFPVAHVLVTRGDAPASALARWRAGFAFAGTVLVAGLYLARQLSVMSDAEQVLNEGEVRFRTLVDGSADVVGVYGPDLGVQYVSGALFGLGGYRPEERIGRNVLDRVHPDDREIVLARLRDLLDTPGVLQRSEFRALDRDGAWRVLEADVVNRLAEPAVRGIVANFRDVTERRRAEAERERSLSLLEATLEATADGILVVDLAGRVVRFNQKFAAMWRIPRELIEHESERAIGFVVEQLHDPQAFLARVEQLYADPEAESFDTVRFKDGRVFERYSLPQRLAGEVVGRVFSFRDVSERAQAEQVMARLVAVIEATPDYVGTCDAAFRPLDLNRAGRLMLGLGAEGPLAQLHIAEFHPEDVAERLLREAIPAALADGAWSGETRLLHRDGHEIPVLQVVLAHRSEGGGVAFFSTIARDISQRVSAERELRRGHTMAALGSLVAGVAHEVRNPLFGISSTLDAFEARFAARGEHGPHLQVLREQLGRLTALMNDLLEYARPTELQLAHGRLEPVVEAALAACGPVAERAGVFIDVRLAEGLPPLQLDPRRLAQVFRNLLENAVQHTPAGGRVRLEARAVASPGPPRVLCTVEDEGPGFEAADLPHVFEPFFSRRAGGTGLRLSIVHRIVADHGGAIEAETRPGGGARLSVSLPASVSGA
jgi:PAS domain S-box-containing protein